MSSWQRLRGSGVNPESGPLDHHAWAPPCLIISDPQKYAISSIPLRQFKNLCGFSQNTKNMYTTQQSIHNATGIIQQIASFLNASDRRVAMTEQCLDAVPETKRRPVRLLCATRWVERHDTVTSFNELYLAIMHCLEQCADELSDAKAAAATACMMLLAIQQSDFLVSARVLSDVLSMTHRLAELLQSVQIDLLHAMSYVRP